MNPYEHLSEKERIGRIGELLAVAVERYLSDQPQVGVKTTIKTTPAKPAKSHVWDLVDDGMEKQVLRYLDVNISASPLQMEKALNMPQRTLARRLERLLAAGLVVVCGKTRGAQYGLAARGERN